MARGEVSGVMGMRAEIDHELNRPGHARFRAADTGFPGIVRQRWDVGLAIKHTHRQLGYALEGVIDHLVRSGALAALFAAEGLRYSVPQYYRRSWRRTPWPGRRASAEARRRSGCTTK